MIMKIVIIMYLFAPILSLSTIFFEKKYKKNLSTNKKVIKYPDIFVLLPALKEQKIVKETIDWFSKMKYNGKIKYIVITSEKEENEYKEKKIKKRTTNQLVEEYLKMNKYKKFIHYHYPYVIGNKSSQMNYAIEMIKNKNRNNNNTYISVFDFDSRPDINTFNDLAFVSSIKNYPNVIQQVPLNIKNYAKTSQKSILMCIYSLQHLVRSLAIEKTKLLLSSMTKLKISQYMMGACMHIRLDTLLENGCFPIFVDDLTMGYRLSIKGYNFAYLPSSNYSLIPNNIEGYLGSSTLIFKGIITYLSEIKNISGHVFGKIKMFFWGTMNLLEFAVVPYMFLIYYINSIIKLRINYWFILSIIIPVIWSLSSYIYLKTENIKNDNKISSSLAIILSPLWFIFRPLGSIKYLIKEIKSRILKKDIAFSKTER